MRGGRLRDLALRTHLPKRTVRLRLTALYCALFFPLGVALLVIAIGGLHWSPTFPAPTHVAYGAPGAALLRGDLPRTPSVSDALRSLPPAAEEAPGQPQGHFGAALEGDDLRRVQHLRPG